MIIGMAFERSSIPLDLLYPCLIIQFQLPGFKCLVKIGLYSTRGVCSVRSCSGLQLHLEVSIAHLRLTLIHQRCTSAERS